MKMDPKERWLLDELHKERELRQSAQGELIKLMVSQELAEQRLRMILMGTDANSCPYDMPIEELAQARMDDLAKARGQSFEIDRDRACRAGETANMRFGQWIPQQWLDLFLDAYKRSTNG